MEEKLPRGIVWMVTYMNERDPYELLRKINDPVIGLDLAEQFKCVFVARQLDFIELSVFLLQNIEENISTNKIYLN